MSSEDLIRLIKDKKISEAEKVAEKLAFRLIDSKKSTGELWNGEFFKAIRLNLGLLLREPKARSCPTLVYTLISEFSFFSVPFLLQTDRQEFQLLMKEALSLKQDWVSRAFDGIALQLKGVSEQDLLHLDEMILEDPTLSEMGIQKSDVTKMVFDNVHLFLQDLLSRNPLFIRFFSQSLSKQFPNIYQISSWQPYISNLIRLLGYCQSLKAELFSLMLSKILELDLAINFEAFEDNEEDETFFTLEPTENQDNPFAAIVPSTNKEQLQYAETLDDIMLQFCSYLRQVLTTTTNLQKEFQIIFQACEAKVLPSSTSKFVQYILFYCCNFPDCASYMLEQLITRFKDPSTFLSVRFNYICYIHGFLQRAKYLQQPEIFHKVMTFFAEWAHTYVQNVMTKPPEQIKPLEVKVHSLFYAVCANMFQTITYRNDMLDARFVASLNLEKIINSVLNPLKVCPVEIVEEFLSRWEEMFHENFELLLSYNNTLALVDGIIEVFSPFDPYLLRESAQFFTPLYFSWTDRKTEKTEEPDPEDENDDLESCDPMSITDTHFYYSFGTSVQNN